MWALSEKRKKRADGWSPLIRLHNEIPKKDVACLKLGSISKCLLGGGILWWVVKVTTIREDLAKFGYKLNMKVNCLKTSYFIFGYILEWCIEIWQVFLKIWLIYGYWKSQKALNFSSFNFKFQFLAIYIYIASKRRLVSLSSTRGNL
jgi:hypothetical protein